MVVEIGGISNIFDDAKIKEMQGRNTGDFKEKNRVSKVTFNEEAHSYTSDLSGKKYTSTTQIIGKFKPSGAGFRQYWPDN